jgi:DNA-binding LacI/PurR family transcriptional regulator
MRVNSHDVARAAGVAPSAVSRAFTPGASVAPAKRERILAAARELGYRPNVMARAIAKGRSNVVGLIMFGETNRDHPAVLLAISRAFQVPGIRIMLFVVEDSAEIADVVDNVLSYQLDGLIAAAPIPAADLATLEQAEVPVIFYNRPGTQTCASVSCDHAAAGRAIAAHLIAQGHRRFALIHARDSFVADERMRGVQEEITAARGTVVTTGTGDFAYDDGFAIASAWRAEGRGGFTALIAANDLMAIGALDALGADNSGDAGAISVAGFDAVDASRWRSHPIASVRQPIELMAEAVAAMMLARIERAEISAEYRLFPGQVVAAEEGLKGSR